MHTRRVLESASFFCVVHKRCHPPRARDPPRTSALYLLWYTRFGPHEALEAARRIEAQEVKGGRKAQEARLTLVCDARKGES
jgi:hypothetical protein